MPQGKGTYGSQVGRPPKKQKYQEGGEVEAVLEAVQMLEGIEPDFPTEDAMFRSQNYQLGGAVQQYKKGGKV